MRQSCNTESASMMRGLWGLRLFSERDVKAHCSKIVRTYNLRLWKQPFDFFNWLRNPRVVDFCTPAFPEQPQSTRSGSVGHCCFRVNISGR